jgi:hypothetical protein
MRNNFLRVILDRVLIEEADYHFNVRVIWRSGFEQKLITFRPPTSLRKRRWSEEEKTIVREHYPTASRDEMMDMLLGCPWHEIRRCAHKLKVKRGFPDRTGTKNPHWTPEEDQIIRDYDEGRIAYSEMLEALEDRPYAGIVRRAGILGMEFSERRIVWRFVDSFHDKKCSPDGGPFG